MQRAGYVVMVPDPEILQKKTLIIGTCQKRPLTAPVQIIPHTQAASLPQPGCWQGGSNPIWSTSPAQPITHGILTQEIFSRHKAYLQIPQSSPAGDNQYFFSQISLSDLTFRLLHTIQYNIEDPPPYPIIYRNTHAITRQGEGCHYDEVLECDSITMLPCYGDIPPYP